MELNDASSSRHRAWRSIAFFATLLGVALVARSLGVHDVLHRTWIDEHVLGRGVQGLAAFVGVAALLMAVGLPRQIPSFLAGYAFGAAAGTFLALAAAVLGASVTLGCTRLYGGDAIPRRLRERVAKIELLLDEDPFWTAAVIRLLPVGNNALTNAVAGVMKVRVLPFLAGSAVGFVPQTLIFALMGKGFRVDPLPRIGIALVLFLASAWLGRRLYRRARRRARDRRQGDARVCSLAAEARVSHSS